MFDDLAFEPPNSVVLCVLGDGVGLRAGGFAVQLVAFKADELLAVPLNAMNVSTAVGETVDGWFLKNVCALLP